MNILLEDGIVAGTHNKYQSKNIIQNYLLKRFFYSLGYLADGVLDNCHTAIDIGCGEGMTTAFFYERGFKNIRGLDFSSQITKIAKTTYPNLDFDQVNIYDLKIEHQSDFVSACEVIEHLESPTLALEKLALITKRYCLLSVPNEPLFRGLNFCAGKYWPRLGSSPGHINHWSAKEFIDLVSKYFIIEKISKPLPWTILLTRPK